MSTPKAKKVPTVSLLIGGHFHLCSFFCVVLSLGVPKLVVLAVHIGYQFCMGTVLDYATLMEHGDLVAELAT